MQNGAWPLLIAAGMQSRIQLLIWTMGGAFAGVQQLKDARNLFGIGAYDIALGNAAHMVDFAVKRSLNKISLDP